MPAELFALLLLAQAPPPPPMLPPASAVTTNAEPVPPAVADLPNLTMIYDDVAGRERHTVRRRIDQNHLVDANDGRRVHAVTRYDFRTQWQTMNGQCLPATAEATLHLSITMPRAIHYAEMSRREQQRWDRYWNQLLLHERNHALSAVRALPLLQQMLRSARDCAAMEAAAQAVFNRVAQINATYDQRTNHGQREGIVY